jgi:hypothetical protein
VGGGVVQHPNSKTLRARAIAREVAGVTVYVAHLDDIIVSKEVADRQADREALPELRALQAAALAEEAYPEGIQGAPVRPTARNVIRAGRTGSWDKDASQATTRRIAAPRTP